LTTRLVGSLGFTLRPSQSLPTWSIAGAVSPFDDPDRSSRSFCVLAALVRVGLDRKEGGRRHAGRTPVASVLRRSIEQGNPQARSGRSSGSASSGQNAGESAGIFVLRATVALLLVVGTQPFGLQGPYRVPPASTNAWCGPSTGERRRPGDPGDGRKSAAIAPGPVEAGLPRTDGSEPTPVPSNTARNALCLTPGLVPPS
jgi:hypothetical protein